MGFIKNNWKWLLLILVIVLGYLCFTFWQSNRELKKDKERLQNNISLNQKEIREVRNRADELTYQVETYRYRADELERINSEQYKTLQKFSKDVEKIESYMKVVTQAVGKIQTPLKDSAIINYKPDLTGLVVIDTTSVRTFEYDDTYLSQKGYITSDTLFSNYTYTSTLEGVLKWEKQGIFKRDKLVLDITPKNPNERVVGLESIKIEDSAKKFWETTSFKVGTGIVIGAGITAGLVYLVK